MNEKNINHPSDTLSISSIFNFFNVFLDFFFLCHPLLAHFAIGLQVNIAHTYIHIYVDHVLYHQLNIVVLSKILNIRRI